MTPSLYQTVQLVNVDSLPSFYVLLSLSAPELVWKKDLGFYSITFQSLGSLNCSTN